MSDEDESEHDENEKRKEDPAVSDTTAEAGPTAGTPAKAKPPETVEQAIARLEGEATTARRRRMRPTASSPMSMAI